MHALGARPTIRDPSAWGYVSGHVNALEGRLLSHRATLDLLSAGSLEDTLARVRQTLMCGALAEATRPFDLAEAVEACYVASLRQIAAASPSSAVADIFLLPVEWRAFRAYLRAEALGKPRVRVPGSAVPDDVWARCWTSFEAERPFDLFAAAGLAVRTSAPREERDERLIDEMTQLHETRDLLRAAHESGSRDVVRWVTAWVQLRLALGLLRCRFNRWNGGRLAEALSELGVEHQHISGIASAERRDWRSPLAHLGLPAVATLGEDEPMPAAILERLIDEALTELVRPGRRVAFGPEPVFAFLWGLRCEAINLRLVITGVAAGLPGDAILKDIRQAHV